MTPEQATKSLNGTASLRQPDPAPPAATRLEKYLLSVLLAGAAFLYIWGLDRNGWANAYYSAAVMAGAQDWTAFLFGSSDAANAISVDKPPLSLWIMSLSVRAFGLSSWSILVPQALMGVLSVYLLFRMVRTFTDPVTAITAAAFFAFTPVVTVMFRYNNPDALLGLLMISAAYATLEAVRLRRLRWLLLAGGLMGAGFLTKQLQIGLIVPAVCITYVIFAHIGPLRRLLHLVLAGLTAAVIGGWWFILVQMTDPGRRPYVGGSMANDVVEVTFGYNGLERLSGQDPSTTVASGFVGTLDPGFQRLLQPGFTGQFGWLLPLAVAGSLVALMQLWRQRQKSAANAFLFFSVVWFVVALTVLAFMSGIVHPYYGLTAVPPLCSLAAFGLVAFLRSRISWQSRALLILTLAVSALLAYVSAVRSEDDFPNLPQILLFLWALTIAFQILPAPQGYFRRISSSLVVMALLLGPVIWSANTMLAGHIGASVSAGPGTLRIRADDPGRQRLNTDAPPSFVALMLGDIPAAGVVNRISGASADVTWPGAVIGSESAANYQLATGRPIMAVGGFNGSDPFPTLEQFAALVGGGKIGALVIQNLPPVPAEGKGEAARIVAWVRAHYHARSIDGAEFYELAR